MSKDVKFNIKINIDGKDHIGVVTTNVNKLRQSFDEAKSSSGQLRDKLISFNQVIGIVQNMSSAVNSLRDVMTGLASGYNAVQQSNTLLTTVMRQRMDASDEDVKKVNDVISAQSQLGVVSGTVQRMGAQQIATFLNEKNTLNTLIPAMNNLIAQQKGVNNTQEDARNIGNLLGKAMQGQTSALRRVGITFTEAQERTMKYGTEQERAAMLAQIITDNVGNMNAELGKTDIGKVSFAFVRIPRSIYRIHVKRQPVRIVKFFLGKEETIQKNSNEKNSQRYNKTQLHREIKGDKSQRKGNYHYKNEQILKLVS